LRRKNNIVVGTIYLILLVCVVFYALCIYFNWFDAKGGDDVRKQGQSKNSKESEAVPVSKPETYIKHIVSPGESIWEIAVQYHPNEDTRKTVWAIRVYNAKSDGTRLSPKIIPGQIIKVPMDIEGIKANKEQQLASRHDNETGDKGY
jgi:LysM repeat protein